MHAMTQMRHPPALAAVRAEIDRIDDAILDLVERRLAVAEAVAASKELEGDAWLKLRPRREAAVIARLTERATLASPVLVGQLWRTLMAHGLQSQAPMEIVICAGRDAVAMLERVRARFGLAAPVRWVSTAEQAIGAARAGEAVAVIECDLPVTLADDDDLTVFDRFTDANSAVMAVCIGRIDPAEALTPGEAIR